MKILLLGEYSRLHNSLKEGLLQLGHEVLLVGATDGFKKYLVDIDITPTIFDKKLIRPFKILIFKIFKIDLSCYEGALLFYKHQKKLRNYDVVQLMNKTPIKTTPRLQRYFLKKIIANNNKTYLMLCGVDSLVVKYALEKKYRYSILSPFLENNQLKKEYHYTLMHTNKAHIKLHNFLYTHIKGVIASDMDYHLPLVGMH